MKSILTYSLLIALLLIIGILGCGNPEESTDTSNAQSIIPSDSHGNSASERDILGASQRAWERYSANTEEGSNWRKYRSGFYRTEVFDRALIAYWEIHDRLPNGETVSEIISELENEYLIPFWPLDPETGEEMKVVSNDEQISGYTDVFVEVADNGAFNYVMEFYQNTNPFSPYIDSMELAHLKDNLNRTVIYDDDNNSMEISYNKSEAFCRLVSEFFEYMIYESFKANNGEVPVTLDELFAGRMKINENSQGHPAGYVNSGEIGDFEFGTDPASNAYYMIYTSEYSGRSERAFKFIQKEISGELIYDITGPRTCVEYIRPDKLDLRIPLLTDEMFSIGFMQSDNIVSLDPQQ